MVGRKADNGIDSAKGDGSRAVATVGSPSHLANVFADCALSKLG